MFAKDKHSSLLRKSVNYGQKSFITLCLGVFSEDCIEENLNLILMKKNGIYFLLKGFSAKGSKLESVLNI